MSNARNKDLLRVHTILPLLDNFCVFYIHLNILNNLQPFFLYILEKRWLV